MKVVYFGTPLFAAKVLTYLVDRGIEIVCVVTKPDRAKGRSLNVIPTPVKEAALSFNPPLPVLQPVIISDAMNTPILEKFDADLFVVVAYGEIIKQHLLDMPKIACINLHASLLPKYRGAAPIQKSIIDGEAITGLTVMHMAKKMDAGDIISTKTVTIGRDMDYGELEEELCLAGSKLLLETINNIKNGTAERIPQDHTLATIAPKIELEHCKINWNEPSTTIHNLVRGVNPEPGAWCYAIVKSDTKRLRIIKTLVGPENKDKTPGSIISLTENGLLVACGNGSLYLQRIQLEGKKQVSALEFFRGTSILSFQIKNDS